MECFDPTVVHSVEMSKTLKSYISSLTVILHYTYETSPQKTRFCLLPPLLTALKSTSQKIKSTSSPSSLPRHRSIRSTAQTPANPLLLVLSSVIRGLREPPRRIVNGLSSVLLNLHEPMGYLIHRDQVSVLESYHKDLTRCLVHLVKGRGQAEVEGIVRELVGNGVWPRGRDSNTSKVRLKTVRVSHNASRSNRTVQHY